jgi:hypothetical protein
MWSINDDRWSVGLWTGAGWGQALYPAVLAQQPGGGWYSAPFVVARRLAVADLHAQNAFWTQTYGAVA